MNAKELQNQSTPAVSVVVCSYNGSATIASCLDAIARQDVALPFEVLVVDDGSTDATAEIARRHGARVFVVGRNGRIAAARNLGARLAAAPVIAYTDDDCVPDPGWLRWLLAALDDRSVVATGGHLYPRRTEGLVLGYTAARNPLRPLEADLGRSAARPYRLWLYLRDQFRVGRDDLTGRELFAMPTANFAVRRDALFEVGGFDPALPGGEDVDLCRRLRALPGARLTFAPGAEVAHEFTPRLADLLRRARSYGASNAHAARKHADTRIVVFPGPVLVALALLVACCRPRTLPLAAVLVPQLAYPGWAVRGIRDRRPGWLLHPYLQAAQEAATMAGEAGALRKLRPLAPGRSE